MLMKHRMRQHCQRTSARRLRSPMDSPTLPAGCQAGLSGGGPSAYLAAPAMNAASASARPHRDAKVTRDPLELGGGDADQSGLGEVCRGK